MFLIFSRKDFSITVCLSVKTFVFSYLAKSADLTQRDRLKKLVNEYTARVEQRLPGLNMKEEAMDLFEWAREVADRKQNRQQQPSSHPEEVDFGARREVGKDGQAHAPLDAELYVRPNAAKSKGPTTKKKKADMDPDMADVYGG